MPTKTPRNYRSAVSDLATAQKSGAGVPAYLRWVNRGLGRRAAAVGFVWGLSPNAMTTLSALLSLGGIVVIAFAPSTITAAFSATFLLLAGYALDSADGQLARLTHSGSSAGEWLDHVVDAARMPLLHLAFAVHFFLKDADIWPSLIAILFMIVSSTWFFAQTLAGKLLPPPAKTEDSPAWISFAKLPYDDGTLFLIVITLAWGTVFSTLYVALFVITTAVAALSLVRKFQLLKSESTARSSIRT